MEFRNIENGFELYFKGEMIYRLSRGDYLCELGIGRNDYSMNRGTFNIKEKLDFKKEFRVKSIDVEKKRAVAHSTSLDMIFTIENENRIKIEPDIIGDYNRMWIKIPAGKFESVYGCGEHYTELNLRGEKVDIWVSEHINAMQTAKKIVKHTLGIKNSQKKKDFSAYRTYYAQPTFVSSRKYYFHSETSSRAEFDFSNEKYHYIKTDDTSPFYVAFGSNYKEIFKDRADLLGTQPLLPDWVYDGAILGIQGGTDIMMKKLDACLKADTAVCGIWIQDWQGRRVTAVGKQLQWNWEWDSELYPSLDVKIKELKEQGVRVLGYINPFLAVEKPLYKEAHNKGYCVKDKNGEDYFVKITTFPAAMIDLTNKDAYNWLKKIIKTNMIDFGFSGWMADFGEYLPADCVLANGENPELMHNKWPSLWAKLNREAVEESGKLGEIMFFTRAGSTQSIKYSTMMWNGDNHTDFSADFGLPSVIPAALSLSCSGFGLSHSDIGGYTSIFTLKRSEELFMRWSEMNAFSPLMRSHEGLAPDKNAQFDSSEEVLAHHSKMSRLHKALKPYLKKCVKENSQNSMGVMRPLFFHYDEERAYKEMYEYLLGRDILVAPVLSENTDKREVYLPSDKWVHLFSGKEYVGGMNTVDSPIGEPPVFIRKDSECFDELYTALTNSI